MNIKIREMQPADAEAVAALSEQLGYTCSVTDTAERIAQLLNSPQDYIVVAGIDGRIVGWMHVFKTVRIEAGAYAEIAALVVDEHFRGKKTGALLVEEARNWTNAQGINKIVVRSNVLRERAHRFYTNCGFAEKKEHKVFELEL